MTLRRGTRNDMMLFEARQDTDWVATHYQRVCEWCRESIRLNEPVAYLTDNGTRWRLHVECGRTWQAQKRDSIIANCRENDRLAREWRALEIAAPA